MLPRGQRPRPCPVSRIGRQQGASREWRPGSTLGFVVLVCLAIWVTLDLNQPQSGWITVSQEPMQRLLSTMQK